MSDVWNRINKILPFKNLRETSKYPADDVFESLGEKITIKTGVTSIGLRLSNDKLYITLDFEDFKWAFGEEATNELKKIEELFATDKLKTELLSFDIIS